jgi:hypothetical protein
LVEEGCGGFFEGGGVLLGGGAEVGGGDACVVEFAGVAYIPAFEAFGGDFGMELKGEGVVSEGEGLLVVTIGFCQVEGAGGEIEGVSMPVEYG